jgi:hypothetical protein
MRLVTRIEKLISAYVVPSPCSKLPVSIFALASDIFEAIRASTPLPLVASTLIVTIKDFDESGAQWTSIHLVGSFDALLDTEQSCV